MVEDFVSENLEHPLPFVLYDSASGQSFPDMTEGDSDRSKNQESLIDLGLVPTSVLSFAWHPEVAEEIKAQLGPEATYLKDSVLALNKAD